MNELQKRINEIWDSLINKWLQENRNPKSKYLLNTCIDQAVEEMQKEIDLKYIKETMKNYPEREWWTQVQRLVPILEKWLGNEK